MGVESRQWPIYVHASTSEKFRSEYDRIFGKKESKAGALPVPVVPESKPAPKPKKTKQEISPVDNT